MKPLTIFLYIFGTILFGYGYWGLNTKAGRIKYDEMASIIPAFMSLIGGLAFGIALILSLIIYIKHRKSLTNK